MKIPKCPNCDNDLSDLYFRKGCTYVYDEDTGTYFETQPWVQVECPHCGDQCNVEELIGRNPEDFDMIKETTDEHGVQRRCEYCQHFDKLESGYVDGFCVEGGANDEIIDMTEPLTGHDCCAFKLCEILEEIINELALDEEGVIQGED